jgi:hypothetical protein
LSTLPAFFVDLLPWLTLDDVGLCCLIEYLALAFTFEDAGVYERASAGVFGIVVLVIHEERTSDSFNFTPVTLPIVFFREYGD